MNTIRVKIGGNGRMPRKKTIFVGNSWKKISLKISFFLIVQCTCHVEYQLHISNIVSKAC